MGLFYTKESEGSVYYNGTSSSAVGNAVPPGGCFVYKWYVIAVEDGRKSRENSPSQWKATSYMPGRGRKTSIKA